MDVRTMIAKLSKSYTADVESLLADQGLAVAAKAMEGAEKVDDHWTPGKKHDAATAEEVNIGPGQAAAGGNVERMVATYSAVAPQAGTEADAEKLLANLSSLSATVKAQGAAINALMGSVQSTNALLAGLLTQKADTAVAAKAEEEDEKDEITEKAKADAGTFLKSAEGLLARAKSLKKAIEDMDEDDDKAEIKASKAKIRKCRKDASIALAKAQRCAYMAGSTELKKSVLDIAAKSECDIADEDAMEKAEAEDKPEDKVAEKAEGKDAGNQADRQDAADGNQDAAQKAASDATAAKVEKALAGLGILQTDMHTIIDLVKGQSKQITTQKAEIVPPANMLEQIATALDHSLITPGQAVQAETLVQTAEAVAKGHVSRSVFESSLEKAPAAVRALFANAA